MSRLDAIDARLIAFERATLELDATTGLGLGSALDRKAASRRAIHDAAPADLAFLLRLVRIVEDAPAWHCICGGKKVDASGAPCGGTICEIRRETR